MITPLYLGICALILPFLFLQVVKNRMKHKVSLGDGGVDALQKARSVHGNFVETVPFILLIMFFLEQQAYPAFVIHAFGIALIVSRILHYVGIHKLSPIGQPRFYAGVTTVTSMILGGLLLFASYIF